MLVDGSSTNHTLDRNLYTAVNSCEKLRAKIHVEKSDALDRNSINPIYMGWHSLSVPCIYTSSRGVGQNEPWLASNIKNARATDKI